MAVFRLLQILIALCVLIAPHILDVLIILSKFHKETLFDVSVYFDKRLVIISKFA